MEFEFRCEYFQRRIRNLGVNIGETDEGCYLGENQMLNFCAPKNDRKIYIMCAIISSLTEFKDSSRADIQPSSVSKLTPSPNLRGKDLQHSPSTICLCIKFRFGSCADVWDVVGAIPYQHKSSAKKLPA